MFNNILRCLGSRATIGIADRAAADRLRDRDKAAGICNNFAEISDHRRDRRYRRGSDPKLNSILNEDWSNYSHKTTFKGENSVTPVSIQDGV